MGATPRHGYGCASASGLASQWSCPRGRGKVPVMSPRDLSSATPNQESWTRALRRHCGLLLSLVAIAWAVEILDWLMPGSFDRWGIRPRRLEGLSGIGLAPFLHGGFAHLASNTLPFLVLGGMVLMGGRRLFVLLSLSLITLAGGALWMLGPSGTNHIGASLLVFGYLGFLLARGIVERSLFWTAVSILVLIAYGGMMRGVVPGVPGVSWQGHLFGFLAGVVCAKLFLTSQPNGRKGGRSLE